MQCGVGQWCFFVFKQKTAYDMRISDWSSDVCSSDLGLPWRTCILERRIKFLQQSAALVAKNMFLTSVFERNSIPNERAVSSLHNDIKTRNAPQLRSEERRVGKECVSTGRSRRSP